MDIAIIKYNAGNIQSVLFALERLGIHARVTDVPEEIAGADKVIFPGVGEASSTMKYLKERKLDHVICSLKQPVLGICLGMQLMCKHSEENDTPCLGIFDTHVKKFTVDLKIPQIGWNEIENLKTPLFTDLPLNPYVYFVHSYYADICNETIGSTRYGIDFSCALATRNFMGVQFHPEKSGEVGAKILENFIKKFLPTCK